MPCVLALGLAAGLTTTAVQAQQNRIYRCDAGSGPPVYQNTPGPGCRALDLPPLTSVPAAATPAAPRPSTDVTPANFPRVDANRQRERDADRRRILQQELGRERDRLAEARHEYNNGEPERRGDERNYQKYLERVERLKRQIELSESNVGSLQRELDSLK